MGAGHGHALYVHRSSAVHRLPPQCKVVAAVLFVLAVVATPREAVWAFALHLGALLAVAVVARVPVALALRRLALAVPFVAFALLLPFVARGDRVDVAGIGLAVEGLWGAWNVVAKATIGMLTSVVLGASTDLPDLLRGLERLRVPRVFTATAGFMVRYLDVVAGELARSRIARISRGDDPRWLWQARGVARSAGTLFVRSYERGERVHLAMLSRGYTGHLPAGAGHAAPAGPWAAALALPLAGAVVALAARGGPGGVTAAPGHGGPGGSDPGTGGAPALEVRGLAYAHPDGTPALRGVDLRVEPGERVALLGPNGAGKTTLVLHLNGIHVPAAGEVRVGGVPVTRATLREVRRRVGIVFQDPDDQLFMPTVRDDVAFGPVNLGLRGVELDERVAAALAAVGMGDVADRPPHHLSFGQRRRVAVATVLAMEPDLLVLDEPTSNLDPAGRRELARILLDLGLTTLMVTHDLPYALELCPRAVVLSDGTIVADGPTADVLADHDLMAAARLELPFGFDPRSVPRPA